MRMRASGYDNVSWKRVRNRDGGLQIPMWLGEYRLGISQHLTRLILKYVQMATEIESRSGQDACMWMRVADTYTVPIAFLYAELVHSTDQSATEKFCKYRFGRCGKTMQD